MSNAWIIGGGLAGATCAYELRKHGFNCHVMEKERKRGGLIRAARLGGVIYEPHGSHIFHTDDEEVWRLVNSLIPFNSYEHRVLTMVRDTLLTWPIQEEEVRMHYGNAVANELLDLETRAKVRAIHGPSRAEMNDTTYPPSFKPNFEQWCLKIMPREVYDDFIKPYTEKQWGRPATELGSDFAPKRVQVRTDGDDRLFKDRFQGFPDGREDVSYANLLDELFSKARVHTNADMTLLRVLRLLRMHPPSWRPDVIVVTVPLDVFGMRALGELEWRGLTFTHKYVEPEHGRYAQDRMVLNWPGKEFPWIRTHETKHASMQEARGTVISTEFTGGAGRYYPVPGKDSVGRKLNVRYQDLIKSRIEKHGPKVIFAGRLASFAYMDMDDVIRQSLDTVRALNRDGEVIAA